MPTAKILPSEAQPPGHGATRELPEPKSPQEWAEARGNGTDAFSQEAAQNTKPKRAKKATKD
jgi:hypothetical protein